MERLVKEKDDQPMKRVEYKKTENLESEINALI